MANNGRMPFRRLIRGLAPPMIVFLVLVVGLGYALRSQMSVWERTDEDNMREWLTEARVFNSTPLPGLIRQYLQLWAKVESPGQSSDESSLQMLRDDLETKAEEIEQQLQALGTPPRIYPGQFPLFPVIYSLEVRLYDRSAKLARTIRWDSRLPRPGGTRSDGLVKVLDPPIRVDGDDGRFGTIHLEYQLHAYNMQQRLESERQTLVLWLSLLGLTAALIATVYVYLFLRSERERELRALRAQQQIEHERAERLQLEYEHKEMQRQILENIGISAASYAHNVKNLLVRPSYLISRCLESDQLPPEQRMMICEIRETLAAVGERVQKILRTVRRDPSSNVPESVDLNDILREIDEYWAEMARDKWKLDLETEPSEEPLRLIADRSNLIQAVENLMFNARDATFEMRNWLREQARQDRGDQAAQRQALIEAVSWRGRVRLRAARRNDDIIIEVTDNGIGMDEQTRRQCLQGRFSTKRDNALYAGHLTGMGYGLSFVREVVGNLGGKLEVESEPRRGTTFRMVFPLRRDEPLAPQATAAD